MQRVKSVVMDLCVLWMKVHSAETEVILTLCRVCPSSLLAVMNRRGAKTWLWSGRSAYPSIDPSPQQLIPTGVCVWERKRVEDTFGEAWQQKVKSQHKCHRIVAILVETCSFLLLEKSFSPTSQVNISLAMMHLFYFCFPSCFSFPPFFLPSFPQHKTTPYRPAAQNTCNTQSHVWRNLKISPHTSPRKRQQWMIEEKTELACLCECLSNQSKTISGCNNRKDASYPT